MWESQQPADAQAVKQDLQAASNECPDDIQLFPEAATATSTQYDLAAQDHVDETFAPKDMAMDSASTLAADVSTQPSSASVIQDGPSQQAFLQPKVKKPSKFKLGRASRSNSQSVWQVMQFESLLQQLQDAMVKQNAQEAHRLIRRVNESYEQLKGMNAAEELLESGSYNVVAYKRICDAYNNEFYYRGGGGITNNRDAANLMPLSHFLRNDSRKGVRAALQLRGGGYGSCGNVGLLDCTGYGSCNDVTRQLACGGTRIPRKPYVVPERKSNVVTHHTIIMRVNQILDFPFVAFGLIFIDLGSDLLSMAEPKWTILTTLSNTVLGLMTTQQLLEIYLNSKLAEREIVEGETIKSVTPFWADDGNNHPHRIEVDWEGHVDSVGQAEWRTDYGAFITFEGHTKSVFVAERDYVDLEVTSGLYEYFTTPTNIFNCLVLIMCIVFAVCNIHKAAGVLIALRFMKPVFKVYSRISKVQEFHEKSRSAAGLEEEEEGEGEKGKKGEKAEHKA